MSIAIESNEGAIKLVPTLFRWYTDSVMALLALVGVTLFAITWTCKVPDIQAWLIEPDPILGISNRTMLLSAGALHLVFCGGMLTTRNLLYRAILIIWTGLNCLIFRFAMIWLTKKAPFAMEYFVGWRIKVKPGTLDVCWLLFVGYLIAGSSIFILLKRRYTKQREDKIWFQHWQETRDQASDAEKQAIRNPQDKTGARTDESL
jgi:hypothetical protein